jgi:hypothetical protein
LFSRIYADPEQGSGYPKDATRGAENSLPLTYALMPVGPEDFHGTHHANMIEIEPQAKAWQRNATQRNAQSCCIHMARQYNHGRVQRVLKTLMRIRSLQWAGVLRRLEIRKPVFFGVTPAENHNNIIGVRHNETLGINVPALTHCNEVDKGIPQLSTVVFIWVLFFK